MTEGYSFADLSAVVKDAAMGPIRNVKSIVNMDKDKLREVNIQDFIDALNKFQPSVSDGTIQEFKNWQKKN